MATASSLLTFWHIATVMPPEIVYDLKAAGRNESYTGGHIGDATMLVMEGDSLWLRCRSDQNATWLIQSEVSILQGWDRDLSENSKIFRDRLKDGSPCQFLGLATPTY